MRGGGFSLAVMALFAAVQITGAADQRPNILFLFSDDQRCDTIAALGNHHIRTPNLDRLSREGIVFTGAYIMGAMQGAVCMPSRAMLMSGRSLFRVKENLKGQGTWPEQFGKAGYTTFITGKWHNEKESLLRSFAEGKAVFLGGMGNPYKLSLVDISADHQLVNKRTSVEHSVKLFADAAIEFIERQKGDQPWLCYYAPNCPHDPRLAPQSYQDYYNAHKPPLPANFLPEHPFNNGEMTIRDEQLAPWPRTPAIVRQNLADYYAYINFLDDQIGRILAALRATGQPWPVRQTEPLRAFDSSAADFCRPRHPARQTNGSVLLPVGCLSHFGGTGASGGAGRERGPESGAGHDGSEPGVPGRHLLSLPPLPTRRARRALETDSLPANQQNPAF
jgi:hypothetical protein